MCVSLRAAPLVAKRVPFSERAARENPVFVASQSSPREVSLALRRHWPSAASAGRSRRRRASRADVSLRGAAH